MPEGWQRLHPLSPVVRGGRATIAIAILLLPIVATGGRLTDATPQLAITDIDRGDARGRRFHDTAGGVADHGIRKPQRGPVALDAE